MKSSSIYAIFVGASVLSLGNLRGLAQARPEVKYNYVPPQVTVTYQHTDEDYLFREQSGRLDRVILSGVAVEYANRRFYPIELVTRGSYSTGNPLGQSLLSLSSGVGYNRRFSGRYVPFVRATAGLVRTSSNDRQYLLAGSTNGVGFNVYGGLDVQVTHRWGVRAIEVQNQYLPFGVQGAGSVYWSIGTGAFLRF